MQVLDCIQPGPDEIVLPKTSSSVFTTTNIDSILRNLGVKHLILVGCLTDQCVESAVRDACDLNYLVTLVTGMAMELKSSIGFVNMFLACRSEEEKSLALPCRCMCHILARAP